MRHFSFKVGSYQLQALLPLLLPRDASRDVGAMGRQSPSCSSRPTPSWSSRFPSLHHLPSSPLGPPCSTSLPPPQDPFRYRLRPAFSCELDVRVSFFRNAVESRIRTVGPVVIQKYDVRCSKPVHRDPLLRSRDIETVVGPMDRWK